MTQCKNLKQHVTVGAYQYTTTDNIRNSTYAYKRENLAARGLYLEFPHFTVIDTGAGENEFRRFHYKFELNTYTFQLNYSYDIRDGLTYEERTSTSNMPEVKKRVYDEQIHDQIDTDYLPLALEFWNGVQ